MNKYLKISLVALVFCLFFAFVSSIVGEWYYLGHDLNYGLSVFGKISACWSDNEPQILPICYHGIRVIDSAPFTIPLYGMFLSALISVIMGIVAAYYSLKAGERWRHSITTYAIVNAPLLFGIVLIMRF